MATRRSRIKAVANLPARRNRPLNSDVKKEDADSTEDLAENLTPSSHPPQLDTSPRPSEKHDFSSSDKHLDSKVLTESPAINADRKSVIVSVEKDRKSVIVNRSSEKIVATSSETELNSVKKSGDSSSGKGKNAKGTKVTDNQPKKTASNQPKNNASTEDAYHSAEKSPNLLGDEICLGGDKNTTGKVPKTSDETHPESAPSSQTVLQLGEGNCESSASSNIRGPLRGRRPKPVVNLTAASRKRPASDAVSSTPCSPPVQKTRTLEMIHHNGSESDHDSEASASASCGERSEANSFKDLSSKIQSPPIPMSPPPVPVNHSSVSTTPSQCSSIVKNKAIPSGNESCSSGTVTPMTPQKDSSCATKRKQSSSALKAAAARKNFKSRFNSERPPPRSALTMFDLIFYNPSKNPMKSSGPTSSVKSRSRQTSISSISSVHEDRLNEEAVDDLEEEKKIEEDEDKEQEETTMPVPRVKVGPDGSLILDEQSLVIETTGAKKIREEMERSEVVIDTGSSYGHYKRTKRSKDWSDNETKKFYRALNVVGTDFSLMKPLFRNRTRRELKLKFKKEERLNPSLVNKALGEHLDFDVTELEKECELEEEEEKQKECLAKEKDVNDEEKSPAPKLPRPKKKPSNPRVKKSRLSVEIEGDFQEEVVNKNGEPSVPKASTSVTPCLKKRPTMKKKTLSPADEDYQTLSEGVASVPTKGKRNATRHVRDKDQLSRGIQVITVAEESVNGTKKSTPASQSRSKTAFDASEVCKPSSRNTCPSSSALSPEHSEHTEQDRNFSEHQILNQQGNVPSATLSSSSTSVKTPNSTTSTSKLVYRIVQNVNTPPSQQFRIVHTPPQTSQVGGTAFSSPASRLLPSPNLPRMEPGSLIVLKTPIPENPDRHILQVYMVTNTPPASSTSAPQVLHAPILPGIHVLPAPSATLTKAPSVCVSSDSDSEKVLTTL